MKTIIEFYDKIWGNAIQRVILVAFVVLNILLMVCSVPGGPYVAGADAAVSMEPARGLIEGAGFVHPNGELYTWGTPLYPVFLAIFIGIFPWKIALYVIVAAQCVLLYIIGLMTRNIAGSFSPKAATLAQIIVIFNPNMLITAHLIQTEILFTFFLTAGVMMLLCFHENPSWKKRGGICGLLIGLATLVRPVGQFIVLLLPVLFGLFGIGRNRSFWSRALFAGILASILAILIISPWVLRNYKLFDSAFLTVNKGYYLEAQYRQLLHNGYGMSDIDTTATAKACIKQRLSTLGLDDNEMKNLPKHVQSRILSESYLKAIRTVPISIHAKVLFESVVQLYFAGGASNICNYLGIKGKQAIVQFQNEKRSDMIQAISRFLFRIDWSYAILLVLTSGFTIIMRFAGMIGLFGMFRAGIYTRTLAILGVMTILTLSYVYLGQSRFRIPLEPYLAIMAAMGFVCLRRRSRSISVKEC